MRIAAIDIGTNSVLCLIAEVENQKIKKIIHDESRITRLGEGVAITGKFNDEALLRTKSCLYDFTNLAKKWNVEKLKAIATSAARDASNKSELINVGLKTDLEIEVISGEKEAELILKGIISLENIVPPFLILDVGGGSTEIIGVDKNFQKKLHSFNIGCVRLNDLFLRDSPPKLNAIQAASEYIKNIIQLKIGEFKKENYSSFIGASGTVTALAAMVQKKRFDQKTVENYVIEYGKILDLSNSLSTMSKKEISSNFFIEEKRSEVILSGIILVEIFMKELSYSTIRATNRGARHGLAVSLSEGF